MQVHFDFTVDAVDAENIFNIIREESLRCNELSIWGFENRKCTKEEATWYRSHAEYLRNLIGKMKCTSVS